LPTISLPLAVWGEGYAEFLPRWLDGVRSLARKPDEIVLVTDEANKHLAKEMLIDIPVKTHWLKAADFRLWDYAIRQCTSDWIAVCNIDDHFLPNAFDNIDAAHEAGANLLVDSLRVKGTGHLWSGHWDAGTMPHRFTLVGAEPMTKQLYIDAGGYDYRFRFPDWALGVQMVAKSLARPFLSNTERILFDPGLDRVTISGANANPQLKAQGTAQVHDLARSLGLL
jgi:hypothetical protein